MMDGASFPSVADLRGPVADPFPTNFGFPLILHRMRQMVTKDDRRANQRRRMLLGPSAIFSQTRNPTKIIPKLHSALLARMRHVLPYARDL